MKPRIPANANSIIPAFVVWAFFALVSLFKAFPDITRAIMPGNDDYMRLVQIRDWLGGQAWSDAVQSRLYPPDPLTSHWTRLPDMLTGGMIKLLTPILGTANAEMIAVSAIPLALFLLALILVVRLAAMLSPSRAILWASAISAGLCYPIFYQFMPGRIDHHGLQIVLALLAALFLIRSETTPWKAGLAGLMCGLSLWVGIESAPYVAAACIAIGLVWVLDEAHAKVRLCYFASIFVASTLACLFITRAPSLWGAACDGLSSVYVAMSAAIGAAMVLSALASSNVKPGWPRLLTIGTLGTLSAVLIIAIYPQCLAGPYAQLDPRLSEVWLANVREAKPFWVFMTDYPVTALAMAIVPAFAVFGYWASGGAATKSKLIQSVTPRTLILFVIITAASGLIQTRMFSFAASVGAPLAGLLIIISLDKASIIKDAGRRAMARGGIWLALSPLFIPVAAALILPAPKAQTDLSGSDYLACLSAEALSSLSALEQGFAITQIDMGAPILAHSNLSVSSAPYHRNEAGLVLALDVFLGSAETAKAAALSSGADYLIVCSEGSETRLFIKLGEAALLKQIADGAAPSWLTPILLSPPSALQAFHIQMDAP